MTHRTFDLI